jgi:hypothetical protein
MPSQRKSNLPRLTLQAPDAEETLKPLLRDLQQLLIQHPPAARGIVQAFVTEGRRFAATPEGQAWQAALQRSDLVSRGRMMWDAFSLDALVEAEAGVLPSTWLDLMAAAAAQPDLESILSTLLVEELQNVNLGTS